MDYSIDYSVGYFCISLLFRFDLILLFLLSLGNTEKCLGVEYEKNQNKQQVFFFNFLLLNATNK